MELLYLINKLKTEDPDKVCKQGFNSPHSYRGYYDQLAFEPKENVTIQEMLEAAEEALGNTYTGWKGGDYTMGNHTDCYLAYEGNTGEELGPMLLEFLIKTGE